MLLLMMTYRPQQNFCSPLVPELSHLEQHCGVKPKAEVQAKYNALISSTENVIDIKSLPFDSEHKRTFPAWPSRYYESRMLFQNVTFTQRTLQKFMLDYYFLASIYIYGHRNGKNDLEFPLSTDQGGSENSKEFTINPLKKDFKMRMLILQLGTTCQLPQGATVQENRELRMETIFEDLNDPVHSRVNKSFSVVKEQYFEFKCQECDYRQELCFIWNIDKNWCINNTGNDRDRFVQFQVGFYWFVMVNDLDDPLRYLKYANDTREDTRHLVGMSFNPSKPAHLRGPPGVLLESVEKTRWLDLMSSNPFAVLDRMEMLMRQYEEEGSDDEPDRKRYV